MRLVKVLNHELGHVLGLEHEPTRGCIMEDAAGTVRTVDGENGLLCDKCRQALEEKRGLKLPALKRFDWKTVLGR